MKPVFACLISIFLSVMLRAQFSNSIPEIAGEFTGRGNGNLDKIIFPSIFPAFSDTAFNPGIPAVSLCSASDTVIIGFDKIDLPNTTGQHSSLTIGPDQKLYALSIDGLIKRFIINSDGTLGDPDTLYSLQGEYGPRKKCLSIGFVFDPTSTAGDLIAWVTHSSFMFLNGPEWDGKLTRLSGNRLQTVQDVLINLPRSAKDHLTNSIAFGPDGALYFTQGSISGMGGADLAWNNRNESLLSAAVLRLDLLKCGRLPLDVKTAEGGGLYNPYAANAALTIYASGVRNAYDLAWHSNGNLYIPTNGSSIGGNTPASLDGTLRTDGTTYSGPLVPGLSNVQQTQKDFLFRILKGGYYGHPNPMRGEYVMNGGNPTTATDPAQVDDYPVGTMPDVNWRGYAFNFQDHKSPNGIIEYKSDKFSNTLKGRLLVVRYNQGDIVVLTPGGSENDIIHSVAGTSIVGFSGFNSPLDLTEDVRTGNIYVSEYGGNGKIELLRPKKSIDLSTANKPKLYPNPLSQKVIIKFPGQYQGNFEIDIIDILGKNYHVGKIKLGPGIKDVEVDILKFLLKPGIYFLKIRSETGKSDTLKLIVE